MYDRKSHPRDQSLTRLGAQVTGLDASLENIQMARIHAIKDPLLNGGGPGTLEYHHQTAGEACVKLNKQGFLTVAIVLCYHFISLQRGAAGAGSSVRCRLFHGSH